MKYVSFGEEILNKGKNINHKYLKLLLEHVVGYFICWHINPCGLFNVTSCFFVYMISWV